MLIFVSEKWKFMSWYRKKQQNVMLIQLLHHFHQTKNNNWVTSGFLYKIHLILKQNHECGFGCMGKIACLLSIGLSSRYANWKLRVHITSPPLTIFIYMYIICGVAQWLEYSVCDEVVTLIPICALAVSDLRCWNR